MNVIIFVCFALIIIFTIAITALLIWVLPEKLKPANYVICENEEDFDAYMEKVAAIRKSVYSFALIEKKDNEYHITNQFDSEIWVMVIDMNTPIEYYVNTIYRTEKGQTLKGIEYISQRVLLIQSKQKKRIL